MQRLSSIQWPIGPDGQQVRSSVNPAAAAPSACLTPDGSSLTPSWEQQKREQTALPGLHEAGRTRQAETTQRGHGRGDAQR